MKIIPNATLVTEKWSKKGGRSQKTYLASGHLQGGATAAAALRKARHEPEILLAPRNLFQRCGNTLMTEQCYKPCLPETPEHLM